MNNWKVLQVIDTLDAGGAERVLVDLTNLQIKNGLNVNVLCLLKKGPLAADLDNRAEVIELHRRSKFDPLVMLRLARILRKYDIIHVHMRHVLKYLHMIRVIFHLDLNIVFHDHNGNIKIDRSFSPYFKKAMKKAYYVGVSEELSEWARGDVGLNPANVSTLSNIILPKKESVENKNRNGRKSIRLIVVSNFRETKNIEFAIDLLGDLQKSGETTYSLDIYGKIVEKKYYNQIKDKIEEEGLQGVVRIITDCHDIQAVLGDYDLALHTAKSETGPLVLMEYMAAGLPFLAYHTGEVVNQVIESLPGLILADFNRKTWISAIKTVPWNDLYAGKRLRQIFDNRFSPEKYIAECLKIYRKITGN